MKVFEYVVRTEELDANLSTTSAVLTDFGKMGWELVSVVNDGKRLIYYFKKEK